MTHPRIGFCCKWIDRPDQVGGLKPTDSARALSTGVTTLAWLSRQSPAVAEQRLTELACANIAATLRLIERVGQLPPDQRMVRLSSDMIPAYTAPAWQAFWTDPAHQRALAEAMAPLGLAARAQGVRLSFHPGQFCVLASDNDNIVERSLEEFEYHARMAEWMGYGSAWHDHGFKINIHMSGRGGAEKFLRTLHQLSPSARNLISIENDEMGAGLDQVLVLADHAAIVLDIHHHWIHSGEYIQSQDPRWHQIEDSWRGVRPVLHYSVSREDVLTDHAADQLPDLQQLLATGHKRQQLRAHSDFYWNHAATDWALSMWSRADICCEAKAKNLASTSVAERARALDHGLRAQGDRHEHDITR